MSKYINLIGQITERLDVPCGNIRLGIHEALAYLDRYPDQVPGRTMTESEYRDLEHAAQCGVKAFRGELESQGFVFIADPEPTNAEKATADLEAWGMLRSGALELGPWLAGQGWTKAPGGDDE